MNPNIDASYIRPKNADDRMKKAHNLLQTVYMYGAAGYGKTSFAASYLGRRKYEYYTVLQAENISLPEKRLPGKERIVVIDDLHLANTAVIQETVYPIIKHLAEHPDVWLILVSRSPVPGWLKTLFIDNIFCIIDENALSLSTKETQKMLENIHIHLLQDTLERLYQISKGTLWSTVCFSCIQIRFTKVSRVPNGRLKSCGCSV